MTLLLVSLALACLGWGWWLAWMRCDEHRPFMRWWFWLGLAIYLGVFELAAKLMTGQTLSQQFWLYHAAHPVGGWTAGGLVAAGGLGLAVHLVWKKLRRVR